MADSSSTTRIRLIVTTPRPRNTAAGPPRGRGPAWERPGARPTLNRLTLISCFAPSAHHRFDGGHRVVAHVRSLDDVDDHLGKILGVVADALDRLRDEHEVDARRDRARVFHHEGDQLAH